MRLNDKELETIKEAFHTFLPGSQVFLYGSRTDDSKRGGDIDLLVEIERG